MSVDFSFVEYNREHFLSLLESGAPLEKFVQAVNMTTTRVSMDSSFAATLLPLYEEIVGRGMEIGDAHLAIANCYKRAHGAPNNPDKALFHIRKAMELGHSNAKWFYAHWLMNNVGLDDKLTVDAVESLKIFRELANSDDDHSIMSLAAADAIKLLIAGKTAQSVSPEDLADIERFCGRTDWLGSMSYSLARFYSDGIQSKEYSGPAFYKARKFLLEGLKSRTEDERQQCKALLEKWSVLPVEPKPASFSDLTIVEKATFASIPFVLVFWSAVGVGLLSIVTVISAWVGLALIIGALVIGVIRFFRR